MHSLLSSVKWAFFSQVQIILILEMDTKINSEKRIQLYTNCSLSTRWQFF